MGEPEVSGVKRHLLFVVALGVLVSSCAGDSSDRTAGRSPAAAATPTATPTWAGYPEPEGGLGEISVTEFNEFIEASKPSWSSDPLRSALEFVYGGRPPSQEALPFTTTVIQKTNGEESSEANVTITEEGLLDDATSAHRFQLEFQRGDDGTWTVVSAFTDQRCARGPEANKFTSDPSACI